MRRDLKLHVIGLMGRLGSEAFDFKKANVGVKRPETAQRFLVRLNEWLGGRRWPHYLGGLAMPRITA